MSKMAEFLRPTMRPIGLSIKKNPIENGLKLREKNPGNWFRDRDRKTPLLNMTYVDISAPDIVSAPETTPGFSTTLNTNLTSKSAFEINQNEFYIDFYVQNVTHF